MFICTENLLFYVDMMKIQSSENPNIFIENFFEGPSEDELFAFNHNQYTSKLRRIIESHGIKWIVHEPEKCQNLNPFDTDDHTISSIERI